QTNEAKRIAPDDPLAYEVSGSVMMEADRSPVAALHEFRHATLLDRCDPSPWSDIIRIYALLGKRAPLIHAKVMLQQTKKRLVTRTCSVSGIPTANPPVTHR